MQRRLLARGARGDQSPRANLLIRWRRPGGIAKLRCHPPVSRGVSMQRREFATALQQALRSAGEEPQESGSLAAALHRGWMNVKQAVSSNDDYAVLSECERGEDSAVEAYREAMSQAVPPGVDDLVETQYSAIKHVHDRIRSLKDANKPVN